MLIGTVGDIHWSPFSSIIRQRGEKYSLRIENCIKSINWAEEALSDCDILVYLGDFFDKDTLDSQEISAIPEIKWNNKPHYFLCGNHEMGLHNLFYNSANVFNLQNNFYVITSPSAIPGTNIYFLPYILDIGDRKVEEFFTDNNKHRIIFSHNDIKGIQYGKYESTAGFSIDNIEDNCDLYMNGHLHNGCKLSDKVYNCGNLTGQNFSENAFEYSHNIYRINSDTLDVETIENPNAFNFYKLDFTNGIDCKSVMNLKPNAVVTAKVTDKNYTASKQLLEHEAMIVASRIIIQPTSLTESIDESKEAVQAFAIDHLKLFNDFVLSEIGNSDMIKEELIEVNK